MKLCSILSLTLWPESGGSERPVRCLETEKSARENADVGYFLSVGANLGLLVAPERQNLFSLRTVTIRSKFHGNLKHVLMPEGH